MIRARMRCGASWQDVCILNQSLHGLGIQAAQPPDRGTYVEIRRGSLTIVARIAWRKGHRAGLRSQDAIFFQELVADENAPIPPQADPPAIERRAAPRAPARTHEQSRIVARAAEFASLALIACALAVGAFGLVEEALASPLEQIRMALR